MDRGRPIGASFFLLRARGEGIHDKYIGNLRMWIFAYGIFTRARTDFPQCAAAVLSRGGNSKANTSAMPVRIVTLCFLGTLVYIIDNLF